MRGAIRITLTLVGAAACATVVLAAAAAQPHGPARYGGTLIVGHTRSEAGPLDPARSRQFGSIVAYRTFCNKLYDLDSQARVVPQLAAALPTISKDRLTYTIQLRKGVLFDDGTPFDAAAVVTTLERYKTLEGSTRASELESVESFTATGPYTVVLRLSVRFAPLLDNLASATGAILSPTHLAKVGEGFSRDPVCVGPFMFDHRVAGDSLTVIKSPWYFDRGRVHLDKIVFKYLSDASAAAALKAGDVHVVDDISSTQLPGVQQTANVRIVKRNALGYESIEFNIGNRNGTGKPPYSNVGTPWATHPNLRKAFELAIDRNTLARVVFGGSVQPGCTPISPVSGWFDAGIPCTPYDRAAARKLIAESGVPNPTLRLVTGDDLDDRRLATFIQAQEREVGINVVIENDPGDRRESGDFDAVLGNWAGSPDPDRNMYRFLATSGAANRAGYSNLLLDVILDNGRKAVTEQARRTLYRAAQRIILNDRPLIYLYHPIRYGGIDTTRVSGVEFLPDTQIRVAFAQLK